MPSLAMEPSGVAMQLAPRQFHESPSRPNGASHMPFGLVGRDADQLVVDSLVIDVADVPSAPVKCRVMAFTITVGRNDTTTLEIIKTWQFRPALSSAPIVVCQPRSSGHDPAIREQWPDQFGVQVVTATQHELTLKIRRMDAFVGWGNELQIDVLAFIPV